MELSELEALLDAKLDPIKATILKLEESNEKLIEILTIQARQGENIKHIREDVDKCVSEHTTIFNRIREVEKDDDSKTWDMLKIGITAVITSAFFYIMNMALKGGR
ncbi:MAG: hypothetical protein KGI72_05620 [Patescibacteria group bacterium]|nr:hypothetical protein [Patescibacteria group bacterium]